MDGQRVFILGPARSGTSVLFLALHEVFGLNGEGESHVIPAFQRAVHSFAMYREGLNGAAPVLAHALDIRAFRRHVIDYIRHFYDEVFAGGGFVDKTPGAEAIAGAALIREAFPEALIIITRRNGIEKVQSHVRKFHSDFEQACLAWTACMQAIEEVRPVVPDLLEIEHRDLVTAPEQVANRLAFRLRRPDRAGALADFLRNNRIDSLSQQGWGQPLTLGSVDWDEAGKQIFRRICGPAMQRFGYTL